MPNQSIYQASAKGAIAKQVTSTPTLTVAGAYVAGDYVGTSAAAMTFTDCARWEGGACEIVNAMIIDGDKQSISGELWIFDSDPTPPADNAAWSITDADALRLVCVIPVSTYYAAALNSIGESDLQNKIVKCASGSRDLYGCFVTRGAPTYVDQDITFVLRIVQA